MSDFKKALGILGKALQANMFGKPTSRVGTTRSGKKVLDGHTAESFLRAHKDWTAEDHHDAYSMHKERAGGGNLDPFTGLLAEGGTSTPNQLHHHRMAGLHAKMALHKDAGYPEEADKWAFWGNPEHAKDHVKEAFDSERSSW